MRIWNKTFIVQAAQHVDGDLDRTFADHARGMGGYPCEGYGSPAEFFAKHFHSSVRLRCYDEFLACHLPKQGRTLSIASGRAANEMRLVSQGYAIVCSDLEAVCEGPTRALFPAYCFMKWDALNDPVPADRFGSIMCLSFVYLLPPDSLDVFFGRVHTLLAPGGLFVLDSAGSPDNRLANLLHSVLIPVEARLACAISNGWARLSGGPRRIVRKKHHGYRYRDEEFVAAASRHGFALEAVSHMDFENEWLRLIVYRRVLSRMPFVRGTMCRVGRSMPYVRMFAFRRGM